MDKRNRWTLAYLLGFVIETILVAVYVHAKYPEQYVFGAYLFILTSILSLVLLLPFFIMTWIGYGKSGKSIQRAIGSGYLIWILLWTTPMVIDVAGFSHLALIIYLYYVLLGLVAVRYFRLPYGFALLPILFNSLALLYLLIYGQVVETRRASVIAQGEAVAS